MQASISTSILKPTNNPLLGHCLRSRPCLPLRKRASSFTRALLSTTKELVLKEFHERRALKVIQYPGPRAFSVSVFHLLCLVAEEMRKELKIC